MTTKHGKRGESVSFSPAGISTDVSGSTEEANASTVQVGDGVFPGTPQTTKRTDVIDAAVAQEHIETNVHPEMGLFVALPSTPGAIPSRCW